MASPLSWFRKYQKTLLVVFGVLLMVAFLLADIANKQGGGRSNENRNEVLVTWKNGEMKQSQLEQLRLANIFSAQFTASLYQSSAQRLSKTYVTTALPIRAASGGNMSIDQAYRSIFQTFIMAERAKELGVVVNENTVDDYLDKLANENLSDSDYQAFSKEVFDDGGRYYAIKKHLEIELAALAYDQMMRSGLYWQGTQFQGITITPDKSAVSPTERWQSFVKANKTIQCQVYPVNVDSFIDKVTEKPSNSDLKELFEQGKHKYGNAMSVHDPEGLQPGFKLQTRMDISYFRLERDKFEEMEIQKITPEQVKAEYDRLVEEKDDLVTEFQPFSINNSGLIPNLPNLPNTNDQNDGDQNDGDQNNEGEQKQDSTDDNANKEGSGAIPDPPTLDSDDQKKESGDQSNKSDGQNENSEGQNENSGGQNENSGGQNENSGGENGGNLSSLSDNTTFVSLQESEKQDENAEQTGEENNSNQQQENAGAQADNQEKQGTDNNQQDTIPQPPVQGGDTDENYQAKDLPPTPAGVEPTVPKIVDGRRILPLDANIERRIRQMLAAKPTDEAYASAINNLKSAVKDFRLDYVMYKEDPKKNKLDKFPGKKLGEKYFAQYFETGLVNIYQMEKTAFGKSDVAMNAFSYAVDFDMYKIFDAGELPGGMSSLIPGDGGSSQFLFWVTERNEPEVPEYEDVRKQVAKFWKYRRAYDLATKKAKEISSQVNSGDETLLVKYPEDTIETGGFVWVPTSRAFQITDAVESPGEEFMETAFGLDQLECGYAPNGDKSIVYVIQYIKDFEGQFTTTEKWFMDTLESTNGFQEQQMMGSQQPFEQVAVRYRQRALGDIVNAVQDEMEVSWQK